MTVDPRDLELVVPTHLDEALAALAARPGVLRPLAGGTDLMVLGALGRLPWTHFLGLWKLEALRGITVIDGEISIGALTTYSDVLGHHQVVRELPALAQAAAETGGLAIQNRGTIGGNLANASPAADSVPALLVYDAVLELASVRGRRRVALADFATGYKATVLAADELIVAIHLPRPGDVTREHRFFKVGPRRAQAISKVCLSTRVDRGPDGRPSAVRIACGGVAPKVVRCVGTEAHVLAGDVPAALATFDTEIAPIDDLRSTAAYRRRVAKNLLIDALGLTAVGGA
jgi:CO/xanthine dehydrogenase FAD-binding subunit